MEKKRTNTNRPDEVELVLDQIDRGQSMRDQIYSMVRTQILTGVMAPGGTVDEKAIALSIGVSRTPVREAIQKLSDEHLVDIKPRSGTRVAKVSHSHVYQAFMIRRALESETVYSAAKNLNQKDIKRLERNLKQHEMALRRKQYVDAVALDDEFHKTIADIANLPLLWRAITIFKAQLDRCRHQTLPREGYGASTLEQHNAILDALIGSDQELARRMMQVHLDQTYIGIQKFLDTHTDAG